MQTALGHRSCNLESFRSASTATKRALSGKGRVPCNFNRFERVSRSHTRVEASAVEQENHEASILSSVSFEHEEEGEFCCPGQVFVQTDEDENTILSMTVKDYPGLLRVVSWVFNGLELVVKHAKMKTDDEGFAINQFWVTDRAGQPLKKAAAELTAERMGDFLVYCTPSRKAMEATKYREGPISVDNDAHPQFTVVTVRVALEIEAALFKVACALTNSGCNIQEGVVKSGGLERSDVDGFGSSEGEREFQFLVTDRSGRKLDYQRATSLMYTLGLVFGKAEGPLSPPSASSALK